jgi:hypothetical protein
LAELALVLINPATLPLATHFCLFLKILEKVMVLMVLTLTRFQASFHGFTDLFNFDNPFFLFPISIVHRLQPRNPFSGIVRVEKSMRVATSHSV